MKIPGSIALVFLLLATAIHGHSTATRMRLIHNLLNRKCLMKCVLQNSVSFGDQVDCFTKFSLPARYESIFDNLTNTIVEVIYHKHRCIDLRKPRAVRQCIRAVQHDIKRRFHLKMKGFSQRNFFFEVSSKLVHVLADFRVHKRRATFGEPVQIDNGFDSEIQIGGSSTLFAHHGQNHAVVQDIGVDVDGGHVQQTTAAHSSQESTVMAHHEVIGLQVPTVKPDVDFGSHELSGELYQLAKGLPTQRPDIYQAPDVDVNPEPTEAIMKGSRIKTPMTINSELLKAITGLVPPCQQQSEIEEEEEAKEHEKLSKNQDRFSDVPKRNPFYGQTKIASGNVASFNLLAILGQIERPDNTFKSGAQPGIYAPEDELLSTQADQELTQSSYGGATNGTSEGTYPGFDSEEGASATVKVTTHAPNVYHSTSQRTPAVDVFQKSVIFSPEQSQESEVADETPEAAEHIVESSMISRPAHPAPSVTKTTKNNLIMSKTHMKVHSKEKSGETEGGEVQSELETEQEPVSEITDENSDKTGSPAEPAVHAEVEHGQVDAQVTSHKKNAAPLVFQKIETHDLAPLKKDVVEGEKDETSEVASLESAQEQLTENPVREDGAGEKVEVASLDESLEALQSTPKIPDEHPPADQTSDNKDSQVTPEQINIAKAEEEQLKDTLLPDDEDELEEQRKKALNPDPQELAEIKKDEENREKTENLIEKLDQAQALEEIKEKQENEEKEGEKEENKEQNLVAGETDAKQPEEDETENKAGKDSAGEGEAEPEKNEGILGGGEEQNPDKRSLRNKLLKSHVIDPKETGLEKSSSNIPATSAAGLASSEAAKESKGWLSDVVGFLKSMIF